jgi:tol-pal system protein YbgF
MTLPPARTHTGRTMKSTAVAITIASVLLGLPARSSAQNREHQQMAAELRMLQEQTQQLSIALTQAVAQLTEAMKTINTRLEASDAAVRKSMADQKVIIDGVNSELRVLRERTQDTNTRIGTLAQEIEAMRGSLSAAAAAPPVTASDPLDPGAAAAPAPPSPPRAGVSPNRLYDTAYSDFTAGEFNLAISGFQNYLSEFPRFEKADDAQLLIGESYKKLNKHQEAIAAFNAVIQNYPSGDKVPEAYFQLGQEQQALNQVEAARATWQTLVTRFPDSQMAILARQRLEGLAPPPRQP